MPEWILYGANGYTGELIAREAVSRGLRPILAGRNGEVISRLASGLGCAHRVFGLGNVAEAARGLTGARAVLHCAGPFAATAEPMMDACLQAGVNYLDITGEIQVIEAGHARHEKARQRGIAILPAVGFDVVPSDCLSAMLAERLPGATHLELAFALTGGVSPGTAKTSLESLPGGGRVRRNGQIDRVPAAFKTMQIPFRRGRHWAMTIPWGDVASAFYSTGIPNIEVYMALPHKQIVWASRLRPLLPLLGFGPVQSLARRYITRKITGPTADERHSQRGSFWGRVSRASGECASATLETPSGYQLTVLTSLAALDKVLAGHVAPGFATPSLAFGREFILSIPDCDLQWGETTLSQANR